jgi:hypothetical protein
MRLPRFRVWTLVIAVSVVALLVWGAMMGTQSHDYRRRAREYSARERGWRETAAKDRGWAQFGSRRAEYYAQLARKRRRAMWCPWMPVAPDSRAPGLDQWAVQASRAKEVASILPPGFLCPKGSDPRSVLKKPPLLSQGVNGNLILIAPVSAVQR